MSAMSLRTAILAMLAAGGLALAPAGAVHAQPAESAGGSEAAKAAASAAGDTAHEAGTAGEEEIDPSKHFNYIGIEPGHVLDYRGKDELDGPLGDGKMTDPETGRVVPEEEPASPPFVFVLINFAILLGILAK